MDATGWRDSDRGGVKLAPARFQHGGSGRSARLRPGALLRSQLAALGKYPVGSDGGGAGVIRDTAGNLYGTIYLGAAAGYGAVYELNAAGNFTVLYNFTGGADGGQPGGPLSRDSSGNLYGIANIGGANVGGVVFKLTPQ